ncbi:MAG: hypothetical protein WD139_12475, partial [Balneolaceae bacterium]
EEWINASGNEFRIRTAGWRPATSKPGAPHRDEEVSQRCRLKVCDRRCLDLFFNLVRNPPVLVHTNRESN